MEYWSEKGTGNSFDNSGTNSLCAFEHLDVPLIFSSCNLFHEKKITNHLPNEEIVKIN